MLSPGPSAAPPTAPPPAPLLGLPAIPDGDPQVIAVQLLAIVAGDKARAEARQELARLDQMTRVGLDRLVSAPESHVPAKPGAMILQSVLRTQIVSLVRLERHRRRLQARLAALSGGPADAPTDPEPSVAQAVARSVQAVCDVTEAAERIRQHEASKLDAIEERIKSLLDTARHPRAAIGGFVQDTLLDELGNALADRSRALKAAAADPVDALVIVVEILSPAD